MLKRLMTLMMATAAVAMLTAPALAQAPVPTTGKAVVVVEQLPDHWLASKFKGTDVIGLDNAKIGDVNDILFNHDGKVLAYVVGVGGFLGIGSKDVALAPASFQVQPATDRENLKLKLAMTKDELKNVAEFKPYKPPAATTGLNQRLNLGDPRGPTPGTVPRE